MTKAANYQSYPNCSVLSILPGLRGTSTLLCKSELHRGQICRLVPTVYVRQMVRYRVWGFNRFRMSRISVLGRNLSKFRNPTSNEFILISFSQQLPGLKTCLFLCKKPGSLQLSWPAVFSLNVSRPALGSTQPCIYWVPGFLPGVQWPGRKVKYSSPPSAEVMNDWSYLTTPPICLHFKDREYVYFFNLKTTINLNYM